MSFTSRKFGVEELVKIAENDFAVNLSDDEKSSKKLIAAALLENGVTFEQYLEFHPERRDDFPEYAKPVEPVATPVAENVVTSADVLDGNEQVEIVTKEAQPVLNANQQWLVKMDRQNPVFEVSAPSGAVHVFTQAHPYVLMSAVDAEHVLHEDGFRQAYPSEIQDYYS